MIWISTQFRTKKYGWKVSIIQNFSANFDEFSHDFSFQTMLLLPEQDCWYFRLKCGDSSCKQHVQRKYLDFPHRKLRMKNLYSSKSLWILWIFLVWLFGPKLCQYPQYTLFNLLLCLQNSKKYSETFCLDTLNY